MFRFVLQFSVNSNILYLQAFPLNDFNTTVRVTESATEQWIEEEKMNTSVYATSSNVL